MGYKYGFKSKKENEKCWWWQFWYSFLGYHILDYNVLKILVTTDALHSSRPSCNLLWWIVGILSYPYKIAKSRMFWKRFLVMLERKHPDGSMSIYGCSGNRRMGCSRWNILKRILQSDFTQLSDTSVGTWDTGITKSSGTFDTLFSGISQRQHWCLKWDSSTAALLLSQVTWLKQ